MTKEQFKMKLNNKYMVDAKHEVKHSDRGKLRVFSTKIIKADFLKVSSRK